MSTIMLQEVDNEDPLIEELESLLTFFERRFETVGLVDFLCKKLIAVLEDHPKEIFIRHGNEVLEIKLITEGAREKFDQNELMSEIMAIKSDMTPDELRLMLIAGKNTLAFFSEAVFNEGLDVVNNVSNGCYGDLMVRRFKFFKENEGRIKITGDELI